MKTTLIYLFQMIAASGLLYSYYHFFLRNKKFHRYSRFYLLAIVIISITIPLFNITVYFTKEVTDNSFVLQTLNAISSSGFEEPVVITAGNETAVSLYSWLNWENILYAIYSLIVFAFLFRIFLSLKKIRHISTSYPSEKIGDIHFVNTNEPGTPFSFFRWLFWNNEIELNSDKGQQIFRHELFHINQRHSLDIFFMEVITALAWFNPFFHLVKKEIKTIHEFLADEYAMNKIESWQYAELLLMQALNTNLPLVNPFFHNQIKRRIAMITTSQKPGHQYLRKLLVLPVAVILAALFAFSYKNKKEKDDNSLKPNDPITIVVDAGHGGSDKGALTPDGLKTEASLALEISKTVQQLAAGYNINVVMTRDNEALPGGATNKEDGLKKRIEINNKVSPAAFISIHLNSARLAGKTTSLTGFDAYISGKKENSTDKILASAIIKEIEPFYTVSSHIKIRDEKGIYILDESTAPSLILECGYINNPKDLLFISNKTNQQKIARAILNAVSNFANNSQLKIDVMPVVDTPKKVININPGPPARKSPTAEQLNKWSDPKIYGVWLDGKRISNDQLNKYKPADFGLYYESKLAKNAINYGKHYYQVNLYSNKYYKEEIIYKWKAINQDSTRVLVVINGNMMTKMKKEEINNKFPPNSIESITVLKNSTAVEKYGEAGKYGVIEIKTKNSKVESPVKKVEIELFDTAKLKNNSLSEVVVTGWKSDKPSDNATPIFEKVETTPSFPGGSAAWRKYLEKNLDVNAPLINGAKLGTYTVIIKFLVNKEGDISSLKSLTHHGFGMEEEVIRVISKGPKWIPAKQNGQIVDAFQTQSVTFVLAPEDIKISLRDLQKATPYDLLKVEPGTEISTFTLAMDNEQGFIDESVNSGNEFNPPSKKILNEAKPGRIITLDVVTIIRDGTKRKIPSKVWFVTN